MKVLSWNIGGGYTLIDGRIQDGNSYDKEDFQWFLDQLDGKKYDFIGLQEAHVPFDTGRPSQIQQVAHSTKCQYHKQHDYADSFIQSGNRLAIGSVSRYEILESYFYKLPNPELKFVRPNGDTWVTFDVGFLIFRIQYQETEVIILNCHLIPFHYFKRNLNETEFQPIRDSIVELFHKYKDIPTIALGDYNYENLQEVLPELYTEFGFKDVFTDVETAPGKGQQDHILYSKHWEMRGYDIIKGKSDHHQCIAELELK